MAPPPSRGSSGRLALVLLAIAVLAGGGFALIRQQRDDSTGPGTDSSPEEVTRTFIEAARTQDCETLVNLVSRDSLAGANASRDQSIAACQQAELLPYEFAVTSVEIVSQNTDRATVSVTAEVPGGSDSDTLELVKQDGAWKVDLGPGQASGAADAGGTVGTGASASVNAPAQPPAGG